MHILILAAVPMGILHVVSPATATGIADGLKQWLNSLPDQLREFFKFGYGGYVAGRSWEKVTMIKNQ